MGGESGLLAKCLWWVVLLDVKSPSGFDLSAMKPATFQEGITCVAPESEIISSEASILVGYAPSPCGGPHIQSIDTHTTSPRSLDFSEPFSLEANTSATCRGFVIFFDVWFAATPNGTPFFKPMPRMPEPKAWLKPVQAVAAEAGRGTGFSTRPGPVQLETHWKQVVLLLQTPLELNVGELFGLWKLAWIDSR